jgi:hypothetical protein
MGWVLQKVSSIGFLTAVQAKRQTRVTLAHAAVSLSGTLATPPVSAPLSVISYGGVGVSEAGAQGWTFCISLRQNFLTMATI